MRTVLCYGDSNTWGYLPGGGERLGHDERWPGVLRTRLGDGTIVVEEGLSGRTSAYDDPHDPILNGLTFLPVCLATHAPIDDVVVLLGTNDLFLPGGLTAHFAAQGVGVLVDRILASTAGPGEKAPRVLAVTPPPYGPLGEDEAWSPHGREESERFSEAYRRMATERGCALLDLRGVVESSPVDGIHFDAAGHRAIGEAVAAALTA